MLTFFAATCTILCSLVGGASTGAGLADNEPVAIIFGVIFSLIGVLGTIALALN